MIYSGQAAIDYLASEINKDDPGASSHWKKYLSEFRFSGDGFRGLKGFGVIKRPYKGPLLVANRLLQRRFRLMGTRFPEFSIIDRLANEIATRQVRSNDLDMLRQSLTLAFLNNFIPKALSPNVTACVIGDGFASMTALLLATHYAGRIVLVNLTKPLLVDLWYLKLWMGEEAFESRVDLVTDEEGLYRALASSANVGGRVVAIQASRHELLKKCPISLALNIASMGEMNPPVISAYFDDLRTIAVQREIFFYCCNRERKSLPDGTVTCFADYPWRREDQILIDELCPWHQFYYVLRPPFYLPYDGPVRHRLVTLALLDREGS